jgi:molecular chaperone DnaJ
VSIPPGIQSGTVLRVRGKGLPRLGNTGTGDLHVKVFIWTPDELSDVQRELFAELAKHEGEGPKRKGGFWSKLKETLGV